MEYILQGTYYMYGNVTAKTKKTTFSCPKKALKERDRLQTLEVDKKGSADEGCDWQVTVDWV
jgi:hypothetical protein